MAVPIAGPGRTLRSVSDVVAHRDGRSYDPGVQTLSLASILSDTVSIWRRDLRPLTILAAAIEIPIVVAEIALHVTPSLEDFVEGSVVISGGVLIVLIYGSLSHHFLAGLLERVVAADRHGHRRPSLGEVVRGLPWARLIVADLVLTALILAGLAAFVVPGLVVMTWFAVVLPLVNLERRPVPATFARSYHLVRGHSWRVALVAVTAFVIPEIVIAVVAIAHPHRQCGARRPRARHPRGHPPSAVRPPHRDHGLRARRARRRSRQRKDEGRRVRPMSDQSRLASCTLTGINGPSPCTATVPAPANRAIRRWETR